MVPVSEKEVHQVALVPFIEIQAITIANLAFWNLPLVERFGHHQEPHPVAHVEKLCRVRIMARSDCVASHLTQNLQPALPNALRHRCSHAARFMMKTDAVQFHVLPVEEKPSLRIEARFAYADR